ncbi:MAG: hypothetical protein ACK53Y_24530, partial [bacterium]
ATVLLLASSCLLLAACCLPLAACLLPPSMKFHSISAIKNYCNFHQHDPSKFQWLLCYYFLLTLSFDSSGVYSGGSKRTKARKKEL